jgi:hypothetical protein
MKNPIESLKPQEASALIETWRQFPQTFFKDALGVNQIWKLQDDLLTACPRAIKEHKHIYIGSGHSLGKDWTCGGIGLWFLHCYGPSIVILTGPTDRQVKNVMWGETMSHWRNRKIDLGGKAYTEPRLEIRKEDWFLLGFTTKESGASSSAQGGKFQGFHAPSVCVIVTEAQAVEDNIFDQIDAITTNENVLVIFLGNPTRASGRFAKGLRNKTDNICFNFSCLDNPNYKEKRTVIPGLCSYEWVEDKRKKWGENDPRWQGRVLGVIPEASINNVFTQGLIDKGLRCNDCFGKDYNNGVAMDVAGEGIDDNVIMNGRKGIVQDAKVKNISTPSQNAIDCLNMAGEVDGNFIVIDCDGLGIGTWQELNRIPDLGDKYHLLKFHGSTKYPKDPTKNPDNYENLRAKACFVAQRRLQEGVASIPNIPELIEELLEIKFFENNRGLIQIEDNDDIKERLGRSPDHAMAWIMLQYGFSLELEKRKHDEKKKRYQFKDEQDYQYNPATV